MDCVYTMGIDVGSASSKCVIMKNGKEIVAKSLVPAGTGTSGPERAIREVLEGALLKPEQLRYILSTGYGRGTIAISDFQMSELSCHAKGAGYLFPAVRTVIDIGGQDAKALRVGPGGMLESFVMNDKCAAGTGRFLEVMARILELETGDLEGVGVRSTKRVDISSTCTVFAESEVISQLAQGRDRCDIVAGIHRSVAGRISGLVKRLGVLPDVVLTGGVARNGGVREALEHELGTQIYTSPLSQYAGAIGAALFSHLRAEAGAASERGNR